MKWSLCRQESMLPQGVVVAILCNMQVQICFCLLYLKTFHYKGVGLNQLAVEIAKCFEGLEVEKPVKVQKIYQC